MWFSLHNGFLFEITAAESGAMATADNRRQQQYLQHSNALKLCDICKWVDRFVFMLITYNKCDETENLFGNSMLTEGCTQITGRHCNCRGNFPPSLTTCLLNSTEVTVARIHSFAGVKTLLFRNGAQKFQVQCLSFVCIHLFQMLCIRLFSPSCAH